MRTILYVGSSTDLSYEHDLLEEWGKRGVTIAQVSALNADDAAAEPAPDPLQDVDVVVLESGEMNSDILESHPDLSAVVILDDEAKVDVEAATRAEIWVTHAANRALLSRVQSVAVALYPQACAPGRAREHCRRAPERTRERAVAGSHLVRRHAFEPNESTPVSLRRRASMHERSQKDAEGLEATPP